MTAVGCALRCPGCRHGWVRTSPRADAWAAPCTLCLGRGVLRPYRFAELAALDPRDVWKVRTGRAGRTVSRRVLHAVVRFMGKVRAALVEAGSTNEEIRQHLEAA